MEGGKAEFPLLAQGRDTAQTQPGSGHIPMDAWLMQVSLWFQLRLGISWRAFWRGLHSRTWQEPPLNGKSIANAAFKQAPGAFSVISVASVPSMGDGSRTKEGILIILQLTPPRVSASVWQPYGCSHDNRHFSHGSWSDPSSSSPGGCSWWALCPATQGRSCIKTTWVSQPYCFVCRESRSAATHPSQRPSLPSEALGPHTRRAGPSEPAQPFRNSRSGLPSGRLPNPAGTVRRVSAKAELGFFICFREFHYFKASSVPKRDKNIKKALNTWTFFHKIKSLQIFVSYWIKRRFHLQIPVNISPVLTLTCLNNYLLV